MICCLILFLAAIHCVWAQTTLFPTIVELISQAEPTQAFPNTAGKTNELYLAGQTYGIGDDSVTITNQIMTLFGFQGIPPGATNCRLMLNIPKDYTVWQYGAIQEGPPYYTLTPQVIFQGLDISLFKTAGTWTWNMVANPNHILDIGPQGLYYSEFIPGKTFTIIPQGPQDKATCPGVTGPYGGAVGYAAILNYAYTTGWVWMNQHYDRNSLANAGVYMTYDF